MQYLCLAYGDQSKMEALSPAEFEALVARCRQHDAELQAESLRFLDRAIAPTCGT